MASSRANQIARAGTVSVRVMSLNKNTASAARNAMEGIMPTTLASSTADASKSENNANGANPRYSLGRSSLGGGKAGRLSLANNAAEFGDSGKLSLSGRNSFAANESRNSLSRRSSVYGKQSIGAGGAASAQSSSIGKDPRPVREKSFQLNCIKNLIGFLTRSGYDKPISQKILTAPSTKDFQLIFKFLYHQLDPSYEFGKKFEEEVPGLLRGIRYPYCNDISKSSLLAVGSIHAWPSLLAMLNWMVELILCCDELANNVNGQDASNRMQDVENTVNGLDNFTVEARPDRIFYDYLCKSYKVFLAGNDDFDGMIHELGKNFEQKNEIVSNELQRLTSSVNNLEKEYQSFVSEESPLNKAEREKNIYANDIEKFKKFMNHLAAKKQKFIESIERTTADLQDLEKELADTELQRASLQAQVDAQDIRPEDIDKMNADKEILVKTIETLNQAKEEASRIFWDREVQVQKKLDAVEKLVQEYNYGSEKSGLIPVEAHNSCGIQFELYFNQHALRVDQMFNLDIKEHVQAALLRLRDGYNKTIHETQSAILELQETLDRLTEIINDKVEELKGLEDKIRKINQQYAEDKESFIAENRNSNSEIDTLDQDLQRMRSEISSNYLQSQQSLQKITIQYDQTVSRTAEEKERVGKEIFRILEELINFKTHIEGSLAELDVVVKKELVHN